MTNQFTWSPAFSQSRSRDAMNLINKSAASFGWPCELHCQTLETYLTKQPLFSRVLSVLLLYFAIAVVSNFVIIFDWRTFDALKLYLHILEKRN